MHYIGIDQSLTKCAWVILKENNEMIDFNIIKTVIADGDTFKRCDIINKELALIIKQYKNPTVAIEGLPFGAIGNATRDLAALQSAIMMYFRYYAENPIEIHIVPPTSAKKLAGGGRLDKQGMIDALPLEIRYTFIAANWKKSSGLADLADAYWIARHIKTTIESKS